MKRSDSYSINVSTQGAQPTQTAAQSESTLIHRVKAESDSSALTTLVDNHTGIYVDVVSKYAQAYPNVIRRDDLVDERIYNIYRFIVDYDPKRETKLSTYIGIRTDYLCKTILKNDRITSNKTCTTSMVGSVVSLGTDGDTYTTSNGGTVVLIDEDVTHRVDEIANKDLQIEDIMEASAKYAKDERFVQILKYRHFNSPETSLSWRQIGKRMKLSHERVRLIYQENLEIIKKHLQHSQAA